MFLFTVKYFEYMEKEKEKIEESDLNFWEDFRYSRKTSERSEGRPKKTRSR